MDDQLDLQHIHDDLTSAQPRLQTSLHILTAFHHRHRNQHHATTWWSSQTMLRRHLHKLVGECEGAEMRLAKSLVSGASGSRTKAQRKQTSFSREGEPVELQRVRQHVHWLRAFLVQRAYQSFTQLVADNQFAHLGLLLVGVLAEVDAAIAPLAQSTSASISADKSTHSFQNSARAMRSDVALPLSHSKPVAGLDEASLDIDLGIAIAREDNDDEGDTMSVELPLARRRAPSEEIMVIREPMPLDGPDTATMPFSGSSPVIERVSSPTIDSYFDQLIPKKEQIQVKDERKRQAKKKETKKRRKDTGDEFDNLFSGLL